MRELFPTTYHRQSAGHWAAAWAEGTTILVQQGAILASWHARQVHALQLVVGM